MNIAEWKELVLEIKKIDEQHKELLDLMNFLYFANRSGYPKEKIDKILDEIFKVIINHIATEETLMEKVGYPELENHKKEHEFEKRKIREILTKKEKGKEYLIDVLELFEKFSHTHLKEFDKKFVDFLKKKLEEYQPFQRDIFEEIDTRILSKDKFLALLNKYTLLNKNIIVILLDIDNFLEINLEYGFDLGDVLLNDFTNYLINELIIPKCFLGKAEGDQFLIAFYDYTFTESLELIENTMDLVRKYEFKYKGESIKITASLGVAFYPKDGETVSELLRACEIALKKAKSEGKNTWKLFNKKFLEEIKEINHISKLLEKAISEKKVIPFIQPIFDSEKRKIIGGEVLLRIFDGKGEIVKPEKFIQIANEKGYIDELENILFEKINKEKFLKLFKNRYLFINKTVKGIEKINALIKQVEFLKEIVEKYEVYPVFEITENSFIENIKLLPMLTKAIKEEKIYLAIDDFGAGYASFSYLLSSEVDFLKIDGSIVKGILKSRKYFSIIKAIVLMAKELGIKTIAEFVEEEKLSDLLYILGVDYLQGFYLAKPMPIEEFESLSSNPR